jgi:hypothetical protein
LLWEISGVNWEDWAFYDGSYVIIGITLEGGARPQHMYTVESIDQLEILNSDVDNDGDIDHDDMVLMARALSNKEEGIGREYDPIYDVDGNGVLNQDDLETLQANMGTSFEEFEIEYVDPADPLDSTAGDPAPFTSLSPDAQWTIVGNTVFIQTWHFSIFRGR